MPQFNFNFDFQGIFERISSMLYVAALVFGAVFAAFWVALIVWTIRDIRSRSRDILAQLLAVLLVALFPLIGLALYLLMRPKETVAESYDRALEEEALLQSLEERATCPKCHSRVEKDYLLCPTCYTPLKRPCVECERLLALEWDVCPFCGHMSEGAPAPRVGSVVETPPPAPRPAPVAVARETPTTWGETGGLPPAPASSEDRARS